MYQYPKLYATFLLWLLSELFERLPEIGDAEKPKLVFFFDEGHLLFTDAPKSLLEKIEQVIRPFFEDYYTIQFDNYAVGEKYLHEHQVVPTTGS